MNINNDVEILMATYNGEKYIKSQIASIQEQTFKNWKLLIADDGSTDKTLQIIRQISDLDDRINLVISRKFGEGLGAALNFLDLIKRSNAQYIFLSDQDDIWFSNKLESYLEIAKDKDVKTPRLIYARGYHFVTSGCMSKINGLTNFKTPLTLNDILFMNGGIQGCSMMMNRALVDTALKYIPDRVVMHDHFISIIAFAFGIVEKINAPYMLYRQHDNNVTASNSGSLIHKILSNIKHNKYLISKQHYLGAMSAYEKFHNYIDVDRKNDFVEYINFAQLNIFNCLVLALKNKYRFAGSRLIFVCKLVFLKRMNDI